LKTSVAPNFVAASEDGGRTWKPGSVVVAAWIVAGCELLVARSGQKSEVGSLKSEVGGLKSEV
jgi:hypothetical protein